MQRALDPALLREALGAHSPGVLPTVEQLTEMIAGIEVAAFQGSYDVGDELVRTAWYLHGVASASEATELYSLARQRRAFRVSAHIFDLAVNDLNQSTHDRLTLAFAAEVGYRRAELDPNATSVYRRVTRLLETQGDMVSQIDLLALRAGVAFLGLDARQLSPLLRGWRREIIDLEDLLELESLQGTMFGPAAQVVLAVSSMLAFLRYGDDTQLELAQVALLSVLDLSAGAGDHDARWVAAHLLQVANGLGTSSVWSVLPPGTPPAVAQAFTVSNPSVLTLWPPQRELLQRQTQNPLDPATRRLLLSMPTSAGKTLLAQLMICTHLATQDRSVCYVSPLRSLGREMRQALRSRLRVLNRELGADRPDRPVGLEDVVLSAYEDDADVDVMTPERLMHMLRRDPADVLDRYSLFVIDEAHLLAQPGRGFLLESLLTFLTTTNNRVVLLSGVLGNAASLANWLSPDEQETLYTSDWRGPRQLHALLYSQPDWGRKVETTRKSRTHPTRVTVPVNALLRVRPAESQIVDLVTHTTIGEKIFKVEAGTGTMTKETSGRAGTPFYQDVAITASLLLHAGSLLMVVSTRSTARTAAQALAARLEEASGTRDLVTFLEERLGAQHPLLGCVRKGVGYHHAGFPTDVLDALEQALRNDQLVAMVATSTLTDGVNLPVRTVVIAETTYQGQATGAQLDAQRLLNAVGRAGRAGRETEGWIVLALNNRSHVADFQRLTPQAEALEATSTMLGDEALEALAAAEDLMRETADAVLRMPPGPATDFVSYVWFVLSTLEQIASLPAAVDLSAAVDRLLGFHQMHPELRRRWAALATRVQRTYTESDPVARRRWATTGTSLATAGQIDALVADLTNTLVETESRLPTGHWAGELSLAETLDVLEAADAFARLLTLAEADRSWRFRKVARGRSEPIDVPVASVLTQWVDGVDMTELAESNLQAVPDPAWRLEQMVDAVSGAFEHYLSWTVGIVVEQANDALAAAGAAISLRADTSSMIRYGVNTPQALSLLTNGVQSRRLAHRVGLLAQNAELSGPDLRKALADLHIRGWRKEFGATPTEVLDLLEFTRARRQSLLRALLESGTGTVDAVIPGGVSEGSPETRQVLIRLAGEPPAVYELVVDGAVVGLVSAVHHGEVGDVLDSGLETETTLEGMTLTFTVRELTDAGAFGAGSEA